MNIKAVIFDFWLTLMEFGNEDAHNRLLHIRATRINECLNRPGFDIDESRIITAITEAEKEMEKRRSETGVEMPTAKIAELILNRLDILDDSFVKKIKDIYDSSLLSIELKLRDNTHEVLSTLKKQGYKIGLICNTTHGVVIRELLKRFHLAHYFDFTIFSDEFGLRKPRIEIFEETLSKLGVKPDEAIHIGDRPDLDILGAKNAGMFAVLIDTENKPHPSQLPLPDRRINNLKEILSIIKKEINHE